MMKWKVLKSEIHGNGVFAAVSINEGDDIGVSIPVISDEKQVKTYQRNTFGLLINDSNNPNCTCKKINGDWHFVAIRSIQKDEEILVNYKDYEMKIDMDSFILHKRVIVI